VVAGGRRASRPAGRHAHVSSGGLADVRRQEEHLDPIADGKALPRLPSSDDAFEDDDDGPPTPKAPVTGLPSLFEPASLPPPDVEKRLPTDKTLPRDKALPANLPRLLLALRYAFQAQEQALYAELLRTPSSSLNDARRAFRHAARAAQRRLQAWQDKHLPFRALSAPEPSWWAPRCHAVPGGSVLVHEDDWGSIIAFTLSAGDYARELALLGAGRPASQASTLAPPSPLPSPAPTSKLSYFVAPFRTGPRLDPDADDAGWHEPEPCSSVISRKQHPRDPTYLLSLRDVLLHKRAADGPSSAMVGGAGLPLSVRARPAVEVSMQTAGGELTDAPAADQLLHELEDAADAGSAPASSYLASSFASASDFVETHIRRGKLASFASVSEDGATHETASEASEHTVEADPPEKPSSLSSNPPDAHAHTITSSLTNAMRLMLGAGSPRAAAPASAHAHHALLSADPGAIDERPHLKYDFTVGKIRFSCTAYYAKQFDVLRRKCGMEDTFVKSMQQSANWSAEGGKRSVVASHAVRHVTHECLAASRTSG
jgi:1-phosphatidylinositol-3-phosphate 5-kinase